MKTYVLIVYSPDSNGPNTHPVDVYGLGTREELEQAGHLLCDGSSGWEFIVMPEQSWRQLSGLELQPPVWGSA